VVGVWASATMFWAALMRSSRGMEGLCPVRAQIGNIAATPLVTPRGPMRRFKRPPCRWEGESSPAAGKKPKVMIVAVMRKMITTLNAMLRDGARWQPETA
jgi:hypothetical protein